MMVKGRVTPTSKSRDHPRHSKFVTAPRDELKQIQNLDKANEEVDYDVKMVRAGLWDNVEGGDSNNNIV